MDTQLKVVVTKIKDAYHARLYFKDQIADEMSCKGKQDIGWICGEMMRWFDKSAGVYDRYADAARDRHSAKRSCRVPMGVKYLNQIEAEKTQAKRKSR